MQGETSHPDLRGECGGRAAREVWQHGDNCQANEATAHMTLTCGTTFTDALSKMVERKQGIALFTMRRFPTMQPENLRRVCNHISSPKSTAQRFHKLGSRPCFEPSRGHAMILGWV